MKIIFDTVDVIDEQPVAVSAPARGGRVRLRNWQVAVVYGMIHTGIVTVMVTVGSGSNEVGLYSLAFHGVALWLALFAGALMK
jgi:hypothetical protein